MLIEEVLAKPVIAALPPSLQERCIATPALIAEVVDNRITRHLPYYRQEEVFAALGVTIHCKRPPSNRGFGPDLTELSLYGFRAKDGANSAAIVPQTFCSSEG